ncbi:MAG TPA: nitroreductase [Coriobacteriia bacterium]|nr:nitroreductase [Coriobacteriia bacterium]
MGLDRAVEERRSIRRYVDKPIDASVLDALDAYVAECNREGGLRMQLMRNETKGFKGIIGRVNFTGVSNYLALVGPDDAELDEKCGYWGEKVLLRATQLGLGSCWFGGGFKKSAIELAPGERGVIAIALGYPAQEGRVHKSKDISTLAVVQPGKTPDWFARGARYAQLAPTARNQQSFRLTLLAEGDADGDVSTSAAADDVTGGSDGKSRVKAESLGGMLAALDLGIVKYHFEVGAGIENFVWV